MRNFTIIASSLGDGEEENGDGIISGFAFPVVSIRESEHEGEVVQLLKLRNPWGTGQWKGDTSSY